MNIEYMNSIPLSLRTNDRTNPYAEIDSKEIGKHIIFSMTYTDFIKLLWPYKTNIGENLNIISAFSGKELEEKIRGFVETTDKNELNKYLKEYYLLDAAITCTESAGLMALFDQPEEYALYAFVGTLILTGLPTKNKIINHIQDNCIYKKYIPDNIKKGTDDIKIKPSKKQLNLDKILEDINSQISGMNIAQISQEFKEEAEDLFITNTNYRKEKDIQMKYEYTPKKMAINRKEQELEFDLEISAQKTVEDIDYNTSERYSVRVSPETGEIKKIQDIPIHTEIRTVDSMGLKFYQTDMDLYNKSPLEENPIISIIIKENETFDDFIKRTTKISKSIDF